MSNLSALNYDDALSRITKYLKDDGKPGLPTGFKCLNEFYSHKQGGVTDWTGFPASGKTYFCLEVAMGLSESYGKRHGLYVPDIGSPEEVLQKILKMRTGKDFHNKFNNKISESEINQNLNWILHHFVLFNKKDFKGGVTPINFWETVCNYKDDGGKLDTGIADSWKNFKHVYASREDVYLDEILSIRNEMAESSQVHFHTIAHAAKTELMDLDKSDPAQRGKRRIPNAWDIKGGASWFANGKSIITVDFPTKTETFVDLYISKVKPEDVGKLGNVIKKLQLNLKRGRYFEKIGNNDCFSYQYRKLKDLKQEKLEITDKLNTVEEEIEDSPF